MKNGKSSSHRRPSIELCRPAMWTRHKSTRTRCCATRKRDGSSRTCSPSREHRRSCIQHDVDAVMKRDTWIRTAHRESRPCVNSAQSSVDAGQTVGSARTLVVISSKPVERSSKPSRSYFLHRRFSSLRRGGDRRTGVEPRSIVRVSMKTRRIARETVEVTSCTRQPCSNPSLVSSRPRLPAYEPRRSHASPRGAYTTTVQRSRVMTTYPAPARPSGSQAEVWKWRAMTSSSSSRASTTRAGW